MKNLMRVLSVFVAFAGIIVLIATIFDTGYDFSMFAYKLYAIISANLLPLISISICAYCMERNDDNYLVRIIPVYMTIPIVISAIILFLETDAEWLYTIYRYINSTLSGVTILSVMAIIIPNNKITTIIKYIAYGVVACNVCLAIYFAVKSQVVSSISELFGNDNYFGYKISSLSEASEFVTKAYSVTSLAQIFAILLLFMTNYAFSDKVVLATEDIDYDALKQDAINAVNIQMQNKYSSPVNNTVPDRTASEKGLMNINNQLGQNSNVGKVESQAREMNVSGSSLEALIPLSNGPVINQNVAKEEQPQVQEQPVEQQTETQPEPVQSTQPNLDIQEQMKMRVQQTQQPVGQQVQVQPQQNIPVQQNNINNQ